MIATGLIGILCGMGLGLLYRMLCLVPAVLSASLIAVLAIAFWHVSGLQAGIALVTGIVGLEIGYAAAIGVGLLARRPARNRTIIHHQAPAGRSSSL